MSRPRESGGQSSLIIAAFSNSGLVTRWIGWLPSLNGTTSRPSARKPWIYVSGFERNRTSSMTPLSRDLPVVGAVEEAAASAGSVLVLIASKRYQWLVARAGRT